MNYKTSLDKLAMGISIGVTILFAIIIIGQFSLMKDEGRAVPIFSSVALLAVYFIVFALRPVSYGVSSDQVVIHRLIGDIKINRKEIKSVELIDRDKLRWSVRTFGVGGLFGYFGKFYNSKIGRMTWYATRRDGTVLLVTNNNRNIILTPDDAVGFVSNFSI